jgi:hypothetical protein
MSVMAHLQLPMSVIHISIYQRRRRSRYQPDFTSAHSDGFRRGALAGTHTSAFDEDGAKKQSGRIT